MELALRQLLRHHNQENRISKGQPPIVVLHLPSTNTAEKVGKKYQAAGIKQSGRQGRVYNPRGCQLSNPQRRKSLGIKFHAYDVVR